MGHDLEIFSALRPWTKTEKEDQEHFLTNKTCVSCCECNKRKRYKLRRAGKRCRNRQGTSCACKCMEEKVRDRLWSGGISFNFGAPELTKYWCVHDHFHGQTTATIVRELKRAIKALRADGVKPTFKKDRWESSKETFLMILTEFDHSICQLGNLFSDKISQFGVGYVLNGIGESDQVWTVNSELKDASELKEDTISRGEFFEEPSVMIMDRNGPIILKCREDARQCYINMLEEGRSPYEDTVWQVRSLSIRFRFDR
jgi:hypothetical protein